MDEISTWVGIFKTTPILTVLFGGAVGGMAFTWVTGTLYNGFQAHSLPVSDTRYSASLVLLAVFSSFFFTNRLYEGMIGERHSGFRHVVSLIAALACPAVYTLGQMYLQYRANKGKA